jgi:hypothetical protein
MTVFPGRRRTSVLSLGLAVVLTVSLAVTGSGFWIALAAAVLGVSALVLFLPRLRADGNGISVASLGGSFRVPWAEIDGFGYGWSRSRWCVQIKRRDGSLVPVRMMCSEVRNGYSTEELDGIVGELRERLAEATGTVDHGKTLDLGGGERFRPGERPHGAPAWQAVRRWDHGVGAGRRRPVLDRVRRLDCLGWRHQTAACVRATASPRRQPDRNICGLPEP